MELLSHPFSFYWIAKLNFAFHESRMGQCIR